MEGGGGGWGMLGKEYTHVYICIHAFFCLCTPGVYTKYWFGLCVKFSPSHSWISLSIMSCYGKD